MIRTKHLIFIVVLIYVTLTTIFLLKTNTTEKQPKYIYKILTKNKWMKTKDKSVMIGSSMDVKDGFIHLSTAKQTKRIANKYFSGMLDGYLLKILYKKIQPKIKWEANSQGELFAHFYGTIPTDLILEAYPLSVREFNFDKLSY